MDGPLRPWDYRALLICGVCGVLLGARAVTMDRHAGVRPADEGESVEDAVKRNVAAVLLAERGATVTDPHTSVALVDGFAGSGLGDLYRRRTVVALAVPAGGRFRDLYRMEVRTAPNGAVLDPAWIVNLSNSLYADEASLRVDGQRVATAAMFAGKVSTIQVRDLAGEDPVVTGVDGWSFWQQQGDRITNLERTGQARGVALTHFTIESVPPPTRVALEFEGEVLVVKDGGRRVVARLDLASLTATGSLKVSALPPERKMPMAFLNWLADRGRGFAYAGLAPKWLGTGIELLKEFYFEAKMAKASYEELTEPEDEPETRPPEAPRTEAEAEEAWEEAVELARMQTERGSFPWPPQPIEPMIDGSRPGEGIWSAVGPDRVDPQPNAPPLFYQTWLHPAPKYKRKRAHVIAWDPARLGMAMRAGTREPIPMTAHRGDGRIPRRKEHLERVVAGFNGGFQTTHIWYGMMVDRKVLLPPRRFGATIALLDDERIAMGSWKPGAEIPKNIVSYRQNLPPLIQDGVFNPYHRKRWGGTVNVAGAKDGWTVRSAICVVPPGHMVYFYFEYADQYAVADTLLHVGCSFGVHLDMNWGHTGFELYRHLADNAEPSDRDAFKEVLGVRFEGSTLHPKVRHMNRPRRYLGVDYRDFFYLYTRPQLPGADLPPIGAREQESEGRWLTARLPRNAEIPRRMAWTWLAAGGGRLEALVMDPAAIRITDHSGLDRDRLAASIPIGDKIADADALLDVGGVTVRGRDLKAEQLPAGPVNATVFALDADGFLWVVRVLGAPLRDARLVLRKRGLTQAIWVPTGADTPIWMYQKATRSGRRTGLLELLPGDTQGAVVDSPSTDTRRLLVHTRERPERVVRLFPEMTKATGSYLKTTRKVRNKNLRRTPPPGGAGGRPPSANTNLNTRRP